MSCASFYTHFPKISPDMFSIFGISSSITAIKRWLNWLLLITLDINPDIKSNGNNDIKLY